MRLLNNLTNDTQQILTIVLEDGTPIPASLQYISNQQGWFISLSHPLLTLTNRRIVASPNMLRAFREIIPFGLACTTTDGYEPIYVDDFSSARASLYTLNKQDIIIVESTILSGQQI